ncbi:cutinase family protein [Paenarthrobacter sp. NPDC089316]|uniref:cutinase family protein n=1 Tax=unclassified Paenarthrobacter TaxID=2634190 RepID=UPI0034448CDD
MAWVRTNTILRHRGTSLFGAAVLTAVALTSFAPAPRAAAADCEPVAILAFRGSGEKNIDSTASTLAGKTHSYGDGKLFTNGWEGPKLQQLFDAYAGTSFGDGFDPESVPVLGIGYDGTTGFPAIKVEDNLNTDIFRNLIKSAGKGSLYASSVMASFLKSQPSGCNTKFIAVGYSQGAMAARQTAEASSRVVGVVDFGDPFQKPNSPGTTGEGSDGNGIVRHWSTKDLQAHLDKFYDLPAAKSAFCHQGDPICSYSWLFGPGALLKNIEPHTNYFDSSSEASAKGKELADVVHGYVSAPEPPKPTRKGLDVMFAIDTTGSMSPYINQAVANARTVAQRVLTSAGTGRVGLVQYKDHGDDLVAQQVVPLTSSIGDFERGLQSLGAYGGGDTPEAVYSGLVEALRANWSSTASRSVILIGDAPAHDPENVTGYTASQLLKYFKGTALISVPAAPARGPVDNRDASTEALMSQAPHAAATDISLTAQDRAVPLAVDVAEDEPTIAPPVSLYALSADSKLTAQLAPIADATGGLSLDISDPTQVENKILESVDNAAAAPEAAIRVSSITIAGSPTTLSAVDSVAYEGPANYVFDTDGDGTFETPSPDGVLEHVFPSPGPQTVSVKVTDSSGRSATASVVVDVLPAAVLDGKYDPANPALDLAGATLAPSEVAAGSTTTLQVSNLQDGELHGARLVAADDANSWFASPQTTFGPFSAPSTLTASNSLSIPAETPPGDYLVLVVTDQGRHAKLALKVGPAGSGTPTQSPSETSQPSPSTPSPSEQGGAPSPSPSDPGNISTPPTSTAAVGGAASPGDVNVAGTTSNLPITGSNFGFAVTVGLASLLIGLLFVLSVQRRRRTGHHA